MAENAGPEVEILLPTFNGERFLPELLDSLKRQTFRDFRILARDDQSSDGTRALLGEARADAEIFLIIVEDDERRLGAAAGFGRLMGLSTAPHVFFCDQDDWWKPDRIERCVLALRSAEARHGKDAPLLLHTDLEVVDADLSSLSNSFWKYQNLKPELAGRLERNLVQNGVTGCAAVANRALLDRALPLPEETVMHDWWLALVASAFGRVLHLPEATVLYRQHGENQVGAIRWSPAHLLRKTLRILDPVDLRATLPPLMAQAGAFLDRFGEVLSPEQRQTVMTVATLDRMSFWGKRTALFQQGILKHGWIRNLAFLARV